MVLKRVFFFWLQIIESHVASCRLRGFTEAWKNGLAVIWFSERRTIDMNVDAPMVEAIQEGVDHILWF